MEKIEKIHFVLDDYMKFLTNKKNTIALKNGISIDVRGYVNNDIENLEEILEVYNSIKTVSFNKYVENKNLWKWVLMYLYVLGEILEGRRLDKLRKECHVQYTDFTYKSNQDDRIMTDPGYYNYLHKKW